MPSVRCSRTVAASTDAVWAFIENMDNWAPFVMGYQSHQMLDANRSDWTVKGDLGPLARTVQLEVAIEEWVEPERVVFTLKGVTETVEGEGSFFIGELPESEATGSLSPSSRGSWRWLARLFSAFRRVRRRRDTQAEAAPVPIPAPGSTPFSFMLTLQAGGMVGPVVNAMLEPLMERAANDLADKLVMEITRRDGGRVPR